MNQNSEPGRRFHPDRDTFLREARKATIVPVVRELLADWWTPVAAFHRLSAGEANSFLLESVEGGERIGRYSFLGRRPFLIATARGNRITLEGADAKRHPTLPEAPLEALKQIIAAYRVPEGLSAPPFVSGAVGYFGYDTVRWVEKLPAEDKPHALEEDLTLLFLEDVAVFDHVHRRLHLVANVRIHPGDDLDALYRDAQSRLEAMERELHTPMAPPETGSYSSGRAQPESNLDREVFEDHVRTAKEMIGAGDIFQVVLSQRFSLPSAADDLSLYRALRAINPSPYMFLLRLQTFSAVGSSPEPLVRITGDRMEYRPIAGTAPRSGNPEEDARRAERLCADPKERAEHVMLVDLGRNDLGRCAVPGTVSVDELMAVERYSHVMHLVSGLSARLRPDLTPLDALYACFPAGTVSGAPKVRAMEIIESLEPDRRGVYAGAVGYLDFSGNLDTCIALRTMIVRDGRVYVQAGAGIVADSDPAREYEETRHKAQALLQAVHLASNLRGDAR